MDTATLLDALRKSRDVAANIGADFVGTPADFIKSYAEGLAAPQLGYIPDVEVPYTSDKIKAAALAQGLTSGYSNPWVEIPASLLSPSPSDAIKMAAILPALRAGKYGDEALRLANAQEDLHQLSKLTGEKLSPEQAGRYDKQALRLGELGAHEQNLENARVAATLRAYGGLHPENTAKQRRASGGWLARNLYRGSTESGGMGLRPEATRDIFGSVDPRLADMFAGVPQADNEVAVEKWIDKYSYTPTNEAQITHSMELPNPTYYPLAFRQGDRFDFRNPEHLSKMDDAARDRAESSFTSYGLDPIDRKGVARGDYAGLEAPDVKRAIQDAGFTSFNVREVDDVLDANQFYFEPRPKIDKGLYGQLLHRHEKYRKNPLLAPYINEDGVVNVPVEKGYSPIPKHHLAENIGAYSPQDVRLATAAFNPILNKSKNVMAGVGGLGLSAMLAAALRGEDPKDGARN